MAKVSIGLPVYNDAFFLRRSLNSLCAQSFTDFELIISDDCSTDGSESICREYVGLDERIRYYRQEKNIGISRNMEYLLSKGSGKYFMWAGDDDLWDVDFLKTMVGLLDNNPNCICAFCPWNSINEYGDEIEKYHNSNYASKYTVLRLVKLLYRWDDGAGYGLFVRKYIQGVKFPIWWWYNKTRAYNNIFPTLFYYLTKGNFISSGERILWNNTIKKGNKINHRIPFHNSPIRSFFINTLWKFNVYFECLHSIMVAKKSGVIYCIFLFPLFVLKFLGNILYFLYTSLYGLYKHFLNS